MFSGFVGILSLVIIVIPFFVLVNVTLSYNASTANPNTSKPGPKFAVDDGALTVIFATINLLPLHPS